MRTCISSSCEDTDERYICTFNVCLLPHNCVTPVAETGFSHRLTAYKIVGHFFGLSYRKISGSNQVKNRCFRISNISVLCSHAQLRSRTVIKKLWTFFGTWGRDRSQSPPWWSFWVKQVHPSTASGRTTRQTTVYTFVRIQLCYVQF